MIRRRALLAALTLLCGAAPVLGTDITGDWRVTISTPQGEITGKAAFNEAGGKVTGWLGPSEDDPIPIDIIRKGNKVTIRTHPQPGRNVAFDKCDLTIAGDKMSGTIDTDKGKIEFVRVKP